MGRTKTESKRAEILEAASRVFSDRDFDEVLIDDVAASAHVGKGTIYRYFETKEDLFFAAILHGFDGLYEALSKTLSADDSPAARLERIAREMLAFHWSRGYLLTLVQRDQRRFAAREGEIQKRRDLLSRMIRECLMEGIERREFRGVDVRVAAELFRGMIRAANELRRPADSACDSCLSLRVRDALPALSILYRGPHAAPKLGQVGAQSVLALRDLPFRGEAEDVAVAGVPVPDQAALADVHRVVVEPPRPLEKPLHRDRLNREQRGRSPGRGDRRRIKGRGFEGGGGGPGGQRLG